MISYGLNDYARAVREKLPNLAFMQEIDKTLRAVSGVARYATQIETTAAVAVHRASASGRTFLAEFVQRPGPATLDEISSKRLLAAYGIGCPREELARNEDEAVEIAARIGFPVVAKLVSAALPHKSDVGGVIVGIKSPEELRAAYRKIVAAVAAHPAKPGLDGILIAEMVSGGLELVLGASRDAEMGPVILFGTGGVDIELVKDVALAAPPLDEARARALIGRTRAAKLIDGYRGRPVLDRDALVEALVGFSNLVVDAGDAIEFDRCESFSAATERRRGARCAGRPETRRKAMSRPERLVARSDRKLFRSIQPKMKGTRTPMKIMFLNQAPKQRRQGPRLRGRRNHPPAQFLCLRRNDGRDRLPRRLRRRRDRPFARRPEPSQRAASHDGSAVDRAQNFLGRAKWL